MMNKEKKQKEKSGRRVQKEIGKSVEFTFHASEAMEVYLAGEFNQWDNSSLPMKKDTEGIWKTTVKLPPGRFEYKLFVDNIWVENIPGVEMAPNPFGTNNFVLWVK